LSRGAMELDEFDRRLLTALQQDSRRTGDQLASLVGLSAAACLRRAQRVRGSGIIEREGGIVAPRAVGRRLTMVILVVLQAEQQDQLDDFRRRIQQAPEVTECYNVTGSIDFVLVISVVDMEEFDDFTKRLLLKKHVKRFETLVVIDRVKFD